VIYFIQVGEGGPIKIGHTRDGQLWQRKQTPQIANPERLQVLGVQAGGREEERRLHGVFTEYRIRGEWFEPRPELLTFIDEYAEPDTEIVFLQGRDDLGRFAPNVGPA